MSNRDKKPIRMIKSLREGLSDATKRRLANMRIDARRRSKGARIDEHEFMGKNGYSRYQSNRITSKHTHGCRPQSMSDPPKEWRHEKSVWS